MSEYTYNNGYSSGVAAPTGVYDGVSNGEGNFSAPSFIENAGYSSTIGSYLGGEYSNGYGSGVASFLGGDFGSSYGYSEMPGVGFGGSQSSFFGDPGISSTGYGNEGFPIFGSSGFEMGQMGGYSGSLFGSDYNNYGASGSGYTQYVPAPVVAATTTPTEAPVPEGWVPAGPCNPALMRDPSTGLVYQRGDNGQWEQTDDPFPAPQS